MALDFYNASLTRSNLGGIGGRFGTDPSWAPEIYIEDVGFLGNWSSDPVYFQQGEVTLLGYDQHYRGTGSPIDLRITNETECAAAPTHATMRRAHLRPAVWTRH